MRNRKPLRVVATKQDLVMYDHCAKQYYSSPDVDLIEPGLGELTIEQINKIASDITTNKYKRNRI